MAIDEDEDMTITVVFSPAIGSLETVLSIESDDRYPLGDGLCSRVGSGGTLTLSPSSVDFGDVELGCDESTTVTVSNTGTEDLWVTEVDLLKSTDEMVSVAHERGNHTVAPFVR